MAINRFFNNFTAGELTPLLDGRADLQQYDRGARTLENVRVMPYGGVRKRAGMEFIAETKTHAKKARLVPFNFSTGTTFVLEFGDQYVRFYSNGVQVESSPGTPYEISSPYVEADLFKIQFEQVNDVVYLAHPSYAPRKLSRVTDTSWTLAEIAFNMPPLREENITATTLTMSHVSGTSRTLTASAALFNASHVGAYFEIRHRREADAVELDISGSSGTSNSSSLTVKGDWQMVTSERWYGTLEIERSTDGGTTWGTVRKFKSAADRNVSASGSEIEECLLRITYTATGNPYGAGVWQGTPPTAYVFAKAKLESTEAFISGLVKVTGYTSSTVLTVDVVNTVASTAATDIWSEGAWSAYRGYPRTVALYEQRMAWGGNAERPARIWGSKTGDFENFEYTTDDDGAIAFDMAATQSNACMWIAALESLLIGTGGSEHKMDSGDDAEPITPSNVKVRGQTVLGSEYVMPVKVDKAVMFVQRQGRKVREMTLSDGYRYQAADVTLLSEHVTEGGLTQLGFAMQPDPLLLAVNQNHLAVMTYDRDQSVLAWARWLTDGEIESVACIYGASGDEIWAVVKRTINSATKRYVERFAADSDTLAGARMLDCYVEGTTTGGDLVTRPEFYFAETTGAAGFHFLSQASVTASVLNPGTFIAHMREGGRSRVRMTISDTTGRTGWAIFDLAAGSVVSTGASTGTAARASIAAYRGHWRCAVEFDGVSAIQNVVAIQLMDGDALEYVGDVSKGVWISKTSFIRKALEDALADAYVDTTSTAATLNRLLWSNTLGDATWIKTGVVEDDGDDWDGVLTISGLTHLEGKTVTVVSSGLVVGTGAVASGAVVIDADSNLTYYVGLPYTAKVKPMKLDVVMAGGATQGKSRRISELCLRFKDTLGAKFGQSESRLETVSFGTTLFTGDKIVAFNGGHDRTGNLVVVQELPYPFTLLGILAKAEIFGE